MIHVIMQKIKMLIDKIDPAKARRRMGLK